MNKIKSSISNTGYWFSVACLLLAGFQLTWGQLQKTNLKDLDPGQIIEQELSGAEVHHYKINLGENEFFQVRVEQKGIDVTLRLIGPNNETLSLMDSPNGEKGFEILTFVALNKGSFVLEVGSLDPAAKTGFYNIERKESRMATARDKLRVETERLFVETLAFIKLAKPGDPEGRLAIATERFMKVQSGWKELKDAYRTDLTETIIKQLKDVKDQLDLESLPVGRTVQREFKPEDIHNYKAALKQGQVLEVALEEKGANVQIVLVKMPEKKPLAASMFGSGDGRETLTAIIEKTGNYNIIVGSINAKTSGRYTITARVKDEKTPEDDQRIEAEHMLAEGIRNLMSDKDEQLKEAEVKLEKALLNWQKLKEKYWEGFTSNYLSAVYKKAGKIAESINACKIAAAAYAEIGEKKLQANAIDHLGDINKQLGNLPAAIAFYKQASALYKEGEDPSGEADTLYSICKLYSDLEEHRNAIRYCTTALELFKILPDKDGQARSMHTIGLSYSRMGEPRRAITYYELALPLWKDLNDRESEASTMHSLSAVYGNLSDRVKALDYLNKALTLWRAVQSKKGEAESLNGIGAINSSMGEYQKAIETLNQAWPLAVEANDKVTQGGIKNNFGEIYANLGEKQKAIHNFEEAKLLYEEGKNRQGKATALGNLGAIYSVAGDNDKAVKALNEAVALRVELGDKEGEAATLQNLGTIYLEQHDKQKALDSLEKALKLVREVCNRSGQAIVLNNIAYTYAHFGDYQEAFERYGVALALSRLSSDKASEANTLGNLMSLWSKRGHSRLAIFYGKLAINALQRLRQANATQGIDNEFQRSFVIKFQSAYNKLAELLIEEDLPDQAIDVMNLYRDQQFFDPKRTSNNPIGQIGMSAHESRLAQQYEAGNQEIARVELQIITLRRCESSEDTTKEETAELTKLDREHSDAVNKFLAFYNGSVRDLDKPIDKEDATPLSNEIKKFRETLNTISLDTGQNTVALYTLVSDDNFHLLLVSSQGEIKSYTSPIKFNDFNYKVLAFYTLLQSPDQDPREIGKQLYDLILKPAEAELKSKKAQTLLWFLDGKLRYVPMSALSPDRKGYLIEKYQSVNFTRAEPERITKNVNPVWTGTGFGVSKALTVDLGHGEKAIPFEALTGMTGELKGIFKVRPTDQNGSVTGELFTDSQFTKAKFFEEMKLHRPLVHITSHFFFRPGDDLRSFLLLGDGTPLTLNEMKKQEHEFLFKDVDLLTLSACKTAAIQEDSFGKEIDGFAESAQRLGASAVIATLWEVKEGSTAILMEKFYKNREIEKLNKAAALRKAQLDLLYGKHSLDGQDQTASKGGQSNNNDIVIDKKDRPEFIWEENRPLAHPYYWSSFVLFGNWK